MSSTITNYNVTVQTPTPFLQQLAVAIIPLFVLLIIMWFFFPKLIKLIAREDFHPLKISKKEKANVLTNRFYMWCYRNGILDKPRHRRLTPKEKRELK